MSSDRSKWPPMVRLGLWRVPSRRAALSYFWPCFAVGIASAAFGFVVPWFWSGGAFLFAALWYYLAIRWVDRHGTWS